MFLNLLSEIVILFKAEFLIHLPLTCYESKNNQFPFPFDNSCFILVTLFSEIGACFIFSHTLQFQLDFWHIIFKSKKKMFCNFLIKVKWLMKSFPQDVYGYLETHFGKSDLITYLPDYLLLPRLVHLK